ncbi:MAG: PEP-CTERM sorting domain-containing protein [Planctomycetota bacterium]
MTDRHVGILSISRLAAACIAMAIVPSQSLQAAESLSLEPSTSTVSPNGGTLSLTGVLRTGPSEQLQAFDVVLDFIGLDLPDSRISIANSRVLALDTFSRAEVAVTEGDLFFSGFGPSPVGGDVAGSVDQLFAFDVTFGPGLTPGETFEIAFDTSSADFGLSAPGGPIQLDTVAFNGASISVSAIPEPNSLIVIGGLAAGLAVRRRRV